MKKIRNLIASVIVFVLAIGFNVVPAEAYTDLAGPTVISAEGTIVGMTAVFSAEVVAQPGSTGTTLVFDNTSGTMGDSGRAIKITGKANQVDARIIMYTDNENNTAGLNKVPDILPITGVDGSGMVGQTNPGYVVPLFWGAKSGANYEPNELVNYSFDGDPDNDIGDVYVVDKRHTHSFTPVGSVLDNGTVYDSAGVAVTNTANDGLYPQRWDETLYKEAAKTNVFAEPLYSTIATVAFGVGEGVDDAGLGYTDAGWYACQVAKLTTPATTDNVRAKLSKIGAGTDEYLYIYIAGNFAGKPAQVYGTGTLSLELVQD